MARVDHDRRPVSAEIEAIREQELFDVVAHLSTEPYQELLIEGDSSEYDPVAVMGIFPFLSPKGITLDLVDFLRSDAPDDELEYFRRIQTLRLPQGSGTNPTTIPSASLDFQMSVAMRDLALRNKFSAVIAFSKSAVHLFHTPVLPASESLQQLKSTAELGIEQQS